MTDSPHGESLANIVELRAHKTIYCGIGKQHEKLSDSRFLENNLLPHILTPPMFSEKSSIGAVFRAKVPEEARQC